MLPENMRGVKNFPPKVIVAQSKRLIIIGFVLFVEIS